MQIAVGEEAVDKVGLPLITNCTVVLEPQPALDPFSVYTVVAVGDTTAALPLKAPGFHV